MILPLRPILLAMVLMGLGGCGSGESCNLSPQAVNPADAEAARQQHDRQQSERHQQESEYFRR